MFEREDCPYCGHREKDFTEYIVGFSNTEDAFVQTMFGENILWGAEALECPKCFEVSWRHNRYRELDGFIFAVEGGRVALKVPGVSETFWEMVNEQKRKTV